MTVALPTCNNNLVYLTDCHSKTAVTGRHGFHALSLVSKVAQAIVAMAFKNRVPNLIDTKLMPYQLKSNFTFNI